jgi:hypothetical protein
VSVKLDLKPFLLVVKTRKKRQAFRVIEELTVLSTFDRAFEFLINLNATNVDVYEVDCDGHAIGTALYTLTTYGD